MGNEARALEPELFCVGALLSPSTGVIDSHGLMLALEGHITTHGGQVVLRTPVERIEIAPDGLFRLTTRRRQRRPDHLQEPGSLRRPARIQAGWHG